MSTLSDKIKVAIAKRDIKTLYDGRILVRDSNDNRYEISDVTKLDKESLSFLKFDM